MPTKKNSAGNGSSKSNGSKTARMASRPSGAPKSPVDLVRECADALYRASDEMCYQHDRISRIASKLSVDAELNATERMCELCDATLRELAELYQETSANVHPTGQDEAWWRSANTMWMASREYLRIHGECDIKSRQFKQHGKDRLEALHTDYELEASAVLSLRHAADAYRKARPDAA